VQKAARLTEGVVIRVLLGMVVWPRYQRTLKRWWKNRGAKPKRTWDLRPRPPDDGQDCRLAGAEGGPGRSQG
jgi:hypothetical protein